MSPEQAGCRLDELGPATDVYSLGATLYHVLTGQPPIRNQYPTLTIPELLKRVERGDFPAPREINSRIPKPLEAICLKAMSLRSNDRYASSSDIADDIEHWLADEPVNAHRETVLARTARWTRKHRAWAMSGTAALALVAVVASVATLWINNERQNALTAQKNAEAASIAEGKAKDAEAQQRMLAVDAAEAEKKQRLLAEQETKRANDEADHARQHLYVAHMNLAQVAWDSARVGETERLLYLYQPRAGQVEDKRDLRGFEWFYWDRLCRSDLVTLKLLGHVRDIRIVAFSADWKRLATASDEQTVKVWDATSGQETLEVLGFFWTVQLLIFQGKGRTVRWSARTENPRSGSVACTPRSSSRKP
ncbi:MAG: hypothetical protein HZA46_10985, partial [Planctomycetales bacterium]|nr:hypothetical protein [Planctomycetales bacterium]